MVPFAVIPVTVNNRDNVLVPTVYGPFFAASSSISIGLERITKDDLRIADKPLRLLEVLPGIHYYYRRTLTPLAWAVLLYEYVYVINMISGGTLDDTMRNSQCRYLFAHLLSEARCLLLVASKGGAWKADFSLNITTYATSWLSTILRINSIWILEVLLSLPDFLFNNLLLRLWYFNIRSSSSHTAVISPGHYDWYHQRSSNIISNIEEVMSYQDRYQCSMPVSQVVFHICKEMNEKHQSDAINRKMDKEKGMFVLDDVVIKRIYDTSLQSHGVHVGAACRSDMARAMFKLCLLFLLLLIIVYVIYYYIMIFDDTIEY